MARIRNPVRFSAHFGIEPSLLDGLGLLDPTLNVDTKLFIDPLLLETSGHAECREAKKTFDHYFAQIVTLLAASKRAGDVAWRNAQKRFAFHEFSGTCLGYGAATISGSGFGDELAGKLLHTAKEIVDLGIDDPNLFLLLGLLEENVGADRISDMVTNVIVPDLVRLNERALAKLGLVGEPFDIAGRTACLLANPTSSKRVPVILVATDVLRDLPIAKDWSGVASAAAQNQNLRNQLNAHIGDIWRTKTRKDKQAIRSVVTSTREGCLALLGALNEVPKNPYDVAADPQGVVAWTHFIRSPMVGSALDLSRFGGRSLDVSDVAEVVSEIVGQFEKQIENKGLWKELWAGKKPRPEKSAQRLFFAIADSFCKAYSVDITPEADSGAGPVDFKLSVGPHARVLVEIKLSSNSKLIQGYEKQLEAYKRAEETRHATYLVIDLGSLGRRHQQLLKLRNEQLQKGLRASDIVVVDGRQRLSASKLR